MHRLMHTPFSFYQLLDHPAHKWIRPGYCTSFYPPGELFLKLFVPCNFNDEVVPIVASLKIKLDAAPAIRRNFKLLWTGFVTHIPDEHFFGFIAFVNGRDHDIAGKFPRFLWVFFIAAQDADGRILLCAFERSEKAIWTMNMQVVFPVLEILDCPLILDHITCGDGIIPHFKRLCFERLLCVHNEGCACGLFAKLFIRRIKINPVSTVLIRTIYVQLVR